MDLPNISEVTSADQARELAIDWQNWVSQSDHYMSEYAEWYDYFTALANKFPELRAEFEENAII